MPKPVTLQDIANQLGISKVSVSKALRGQTDIGKATTAKIVALAEELGYRPNIIARKLSAKQTRTIGLVVPKVAHHFLTQAIDSIYKLANEKNYEIVMMVSEEDALLEQKHIETLLSMHVDGLLVSVTEQTTDSSVFTRVAENGTPLVFFDRVIQNLGFTCISSADEQGSFDLMNCAIDRGHQRFGHIGGYQTVSIGHLRYAGFKRALASHKLVAQDSHIVFGGFSRRDGYAGLKQIHEQGNLPHILFTVTYPVALGVLSYASEQGIRIPLDLDLISFGTSDYNSFIKPSITGISQPAKEIGRLALETVLVQITDPGYEAEANITIPVQINQADTCINSYEQEDFKRGTL